MLQVKCRREGGDGYIKSLACFKLGTEDRVWKWLHPGVQIALTWVQKTI